jgi:hypothetical protein
MAGHLFEKSRTALSGSGLGTFQDRGDPLIHCDMLTSAMNAEMSDRNTEKFSTGR